MEINSKIKFTATSVKNVVQEIERGKIFLPPIQRNFVWDSDRIVNLFDSMFRNYPIGNCIFWQIEPETAKSYPLYKFIREYTENKYRPSKNETVPLNLLKRNVFAVVDGQQRLSSFYIGLAGVYKYKKSGKGLQNIESNFVPSKLYFNLFANDSKSQEENLFDLLAKEDCGTISEKHLWFEVGEVLQWRTIDNAEDALINIAKRVKARGKKTVIAKFESRKEKIILSLRRLFEMLNNKNVFYFEICCQNLDEVVDIFTRVNSGGMILKKSDLLFSILVSEWHEGRDEIKDLVESLRDSDITVSQDFVMRSCLVLSDLPVQYNLESFKQKNINLIKKNWPDIKSSLLKLADLLPEIGYKDFQNLSDNALIPIAYYIMNGGKTDTIKSKKALQQYYVVSQVNGVFGGQSDQVLDKVRAEIRRQLRQGKTLDFKELSGMKLPGRKSLQLTVESLSELVENTGYQSPIAYFLLALIYPTVDFMIKKYEVDHIHPKSKFSRANLNSIGIYDEEVLFDWKEKKCNKLPNLQLLGARDNNHKRSKTLNEYIQEKTSAERKLFIAENLLPVKKEQRELEYFEEFFEFRKKLLVNRLKKHFCVFKN